MNKNEITISTDEYKELVSKTIPDENDKWFKRKLIDFLFENLKVNGNKLEVKNNWDFCEKFIEMLRIIDRMTYKEIFNQLYDEKIKKETDKMKMDKVRANKEIDEERRKR